MNVLVLHGPNVNLLGTRPGDETHWSLAALDAAIRRRAKELGAEITVLQTNHEGALIDAVHGARGWAHGIVLNPGALAHYSYALRDAIAAVKIPTVEVHLGDLSRREEWRRKSVLVDVCLSQIAGKGYDSYLSALDALAERERTTRPSKRGKTLGRAADARSEAEARPAPAKTIGRKLVKGAAVGAAAAAAVATARGKTIGGAPKTASSKARMTPGAITRAAVRTKLAERLGGALTPQALASWARAQWLELQKGAPVESGQRETLEDILQQLTVSAHPRSSLKDDDLIELMAQLDD